MEQIGGIIIALGIVAILYFASKFIQGKIKAEKIQVTIIKSQFSPGTKKEAVGFNILSIIAGVPSFETAKSLNRYHHEAQKSDGTIIKFTTTFPLGDAGSKATIYEQVNTYGFNNSHTGYLVYFEDNKPK